MKLLLKSLLILPFAWPCALALPRLGLLLGWLLSGLALLAPLAPATAQSAYWSRARNLGSSSVQFGWDSQVTGMVADPAGNYYVAGYWYGTANFGGPVSLPATGSSSGFVAKYDSAGVLLWVQTLVGGGGERLADVCLNPAGGCYVVGRCGNNASLGVGTTLSRGLVTAAFAEDGTLTWWDVTGGTPTPGSYVFEEMRVACDAAGRCYVAGQISNHTRTFGNITLTFSPATPVPNRQAVVYCYGPDRQVQWAKATTVTNTDSQVQGLVATANGCLLSATYSQEAGSVLGVPVPAVYLSEPTSTNGLVMALDSLGAVRWGHTINKVHYALVVEKP